MRKALLVALLAAAALGRPLLWPLLENTRDLAALHAERAGARERTLEAEKANAALRRDFLALRRRDPFVVERLGREAGLIRPAEFDYASLAEALSPKPPLPSCPAPPRRTE